MSNKKKTNEELAALRAELEQLRAEKEQAETRKEEARIAAAKAAAPKEKAPSGAEGATPSSESLPADLAEWVGSGMEGDLDAHALLDNIRANAGRFMEEFNEDLKDTKPSTLLLLFGFGVMVGRMTS